MRIRLNGSEFEERPGTTVAGLLERLGNGKERVAVAVNGRVVPRLEHATRVLEEGDRVEVIHAVAGG
jgi:sulfur carrier protein